MCCKVLALANNNYVNIVTAQIKNMYKILIVTTDTKLSFKTHIQLIFGKAWAKLNALSAIAPFMNIEKKDHIKCVLQ